LTKATSVEASTSPKASLAQSQSLASQSQGGVKSVSPPSSSIHPSIALKESRTEYTQKDSTPKPVTTIPTTTPQAISKSKSGEKQAPQGTQGRK